MDYKNDNLLSFLMIISSKCIDSVPIAKLLCGECGNDVRVVVRRSAEQLSHSEREGGGGARIVACI